MALGFPEPIKKDDPRLQAHKTTYQASRGGHYPEPKKPVPGKPKKGE
ncbi:hypothetical protein ACFZBC_09015 [Streptomyces luteogriseus]